MIDYNMSKYYINDLISLVLILSFYWPYESTKVSNDGFISVILDNFLSYQRFHLCLNVIGLYNLRSFEEKLGSFKYFCLVIYLLTMKSLIYLFLIGKPGQIVHPFNDDIPKSLGFMGILFGLMTLEPKNQVFWIQCDPKYYSFILLSLAQLIPHSCFYSNLSGILASYLYTYVYENVKL